MAEPLADSLVDGALYAAKSWLAMVQPPPAKLTSIRGLIETAADALAEKLRAEIAAEKEHGCAPDPEGHHRRRMEADTLHRLRVLVLRVEAASATAEADALCLEYSLPYDTRLLPLALDEARAVQKLAAWHWRARDVGAALDGVRDSRAGQALAAALRPEGE